MYELSAKNDRLKCYLRSSLSVFLADSRKLSVGKDSMFTLRKRPPRLRNDPIFFHQSNSIFLPEEGMKLDLVNSRDDLHILTKIREHKRIEVRYADGLRQSFFICFCDPSVCCEIISQSLMKQDEIHIFHIKFCKGCLYCLISSIFILFILHPDLCGYEQFFPGHDSVSYSSLYSLAKSLLIHISCRGVKQSVSCLDRVINDSFALISIRELKYSESFKRHLCSCVKCYVFHGKTLLLFLISY